MNTVPPFHVAGGNFRHPALPPESEVTPKASGSRRRRLWEIPHKFHCPVIGVCFDVIELRSLLARQMQFPRETTDYVLHSTAVGACDERSAVAEMLHKCLEKRFQRVIRQFSSAKTPEALGDLWRQAIKQGGEIPDALWACWTHPACNATLEQEIFGDIHMIQHQVGSGTRTDLATLKSARTENAWLRQQLDESRREMEAMRNEKTRETRLLGQRIAEQRANLIGKEAWIANLTAQLDALRDRLPDLKDRQSLARRASDAEARAVALTAHASAVDAELSRHRGLLEVTENRLQTLLTINEHFAEKITEAALPQARLGGKSVLCVGGRSGSVDGYRQIVEERGGRFMHHDGGLEENLHRIDAALAAADLVICQAGCISHNAYWRVKEQCKRTGKQCVFVKSAGVTSFERLVSETWVDGKSK